MYQKISCLTTFSMVAKCYQIPIVLKKTIKMTQGGFEVQILGAASTDEDHFTLLLPHHCLFLIALSMCTLNSYKSNSIMLKIEFLNLQAA